MDQHSQTQINPAALRQLLSTHFNDGELRDLCFDLGIEYENLPGQGKADKARELVAYAMRHQRTADLLAQCRFLRPTVDWQAGPQPAPAQPTSSTPAQQPATGKQRRLQQQLEGLQEELELRRAKWKSLRSALSIEAGAAVKFQLEQQIQQEEAAIAQLEAEIEAIERELHP